MITKAQIESLDKALAIASISADPVTAINNLCKTRIGLTSRSSDIVTVKDDQDLFAILEEKGYIGDFGPRQEADVIRTYVLVTRAVFPDRKIKGPMSIFVTRVGDYHFTIDGYKNYILATSIYSFYDGEEFEDMVLDFKESIINDINRLCPKIVEEIYHAYHSDPDVKFRVDCLNEKAVSMSMFAGFGGNEHEVEFIEEERTRLKHDQDELDKLLGQKASEGEAK